MPQPPPVFWATDQCARVASPVESVEWPPSSLPAPVAVYLAESQLVSTPRTGANLLNQSWPAFLDLLDTDSHSAQEGLWDFLYRLLIVRPPGVYARCRLEVREDVRQDVFLRLCEANFRRLRTYRDCGRPFSGWLAQVIYRRTIDEVTSQLPDVELNPDKEIGDTGEEHLCTQQVLDRVRRLIQELPAQHRRILYLSTDGLKPREIAPLMGLDNKTVSEKLRHARNRLKQLLDREGTELDQRRGST